MIIQEIYLPEYRWKVKVYYAVNQYYAEDILQELLKYNPTVKEYNKVMETMYNYEYNTGFTFTDYNQKQSLVIIGLTTSSAEFQNTFDHEKGHLAMHIAQYYNIDPYGEKFQYLTGDIGKKLFKVARKFLCTHCRKELTLDLFSSVNLGE